MYKGKLTILVGVLLILALLPNIVISANCLFPHRNSVSAPVYGIAVVEQHRVKHVFTKVYDFLKRVEKKRNDYVVTWHENGYRSTNGIIRVAFRKGPALDGDVYLLLGFEVNEVSRDRHTRKTKNRRYRRPWGVVTVQYVKATYRDVHLLDVYSKTYNSLCRYSKLFNGVIRSLKAEPKRRYK